MVTLKRAQNFTRWADHPAARVPLQSKSLPAKSRGRLRRRREVNVDAQEASAVCHQDNNTSAVAGGRGNST
jgi:hypothetical protein